MISLKLPRWLLDRLDEEYESRAVLIEDALKEKFGSTPPDVGG
jgi:metal-responsive CopG/Arc/MetJ family transcriptional regulator